jgi:thioesterase domain-containing protein
MASGTGGGIQALSKLAGRMRVDNPIYGIHENELNDANISNGRVEDLAEYYLRRITQLQPHGPYILVGYSLGGLVFLELACRLHEQGKKVGLLALLDTYPYLRFWPLRSRLEVFTRRAMHHLSMASKISLDQAIPYLGIRLRRLLGGQSPSGVYVPKLIQRAFKTNEPGVPEVIMRYQPRTYPGKITFFKCDRRSVYPDPIMAWGKLAKEIDLRTIPGDHLEIFTTQIDGVAARLSLCLQAYNQSAARDR